MDNNSEKISKCPVTGATGKHSIGAGGTKNRDWWPNQLKLNMQQMFFATEYRSEAEAPSGFRQDR